VFNTFRYVISGVPANISTDEVKDFADCNLVKRITRRENGMDVNTETCILTYDEELVLPVTLRYAFLTYKVRKYTTNPMQCQHCFKYGHTAKHCRHTAICSNCSSSSHATDQCRSTEQKCVNCGGKHAAMNKICTKYVQVKQILAVVDSDKLSYRDAARKVTASSLKSVAKTNDIVSKTAVMGSPIASARPIGINATVTTAVSNEISARLEVKLDLVLTKIATLSNQFDDKISVLRQEVTEHCQKLTIDLTIDAEKREMHLEAKLQVVTSNVATQQEQHEALRTEIKKLLKNKAESVTNLTNSFTKLNERFTQLHENVVLWFNSKPWNPILEETQQSIAEIESATEAMNDVDYASLGEITKGAQLSTLDNLERIRKRCRLYDANFRVIGTQLKLNLNTVYDPVEPDKSA